MVEPLVKKIILNDRQLDFMYLQSSYQGYGGAKGGGKSFAVRAKKLARRSKYAGSKGLTLRRTYPELERTHILQIVTEWAGLGTWKSKENRFYFWNGSFEEFGHCQYEKDVGKYQGAEYDDIAIDEATQFTEFMIETFRTNMRTTRTDLETQMYLTANPGGVGHGYYKRRFIDNLPGSKWYDKNYTFVPAKVYDNHILMQADPDYVKKLESLPEAQRKAFLEGDWNIFEGQALTEWRPEKHIQPTFPYSLDACKKIISFDWGYNAPGCATWIAFAPENRYGIRRAYVYRELYQNMKTPEQWAEQIKLFVRIEKVDYMVLPHDCFAKVHGRPSIASVFEASFGDYCRIRTGETLVRGARHMRLAILHNWLAESPLEPGRPLLTFSPKCVNTNRTLPELIMSDNDPEDINTDGEDHAFDSLSLGLMTESGDTSRGGGAVKQERGRMAVQRVFKTNDDGLIKTPDFVEHFRDELSYKRR
jgi:phage terminase large subunit